MNSNVDERQLRSEILSLEQRLTDLRAQLQAPHGHEEVVQNGEKGEAFLL